MDAPKRLPARRSVFAVRFSLRLLLAALTAFAIGFPIWYRWPYTETVFWYPEVDGQPDESKPPRGWSEVPWQRQWGGGRLMHGVIKWYGADGTMLATSAYRHGKRHGRHESFGEDGSLQSMDEHADGTRIRITTYRGDGSISYRAEMEGRFLHGKAEQHVRDGPVVVWQFDHGRVVSRNGEPIHSRLFDALSAGMVEKRLAERLRLISADSVHAATPQGQLEELAELGGVPLVIEHPEALEWIEPQFVPIFGIDMPSALEMKARALGRQCEYFDGKVWVTSQ